MESIYTKCYKDQRMQQRSSDTGKASILLHDLLDVLPKVDPTRVQSTIERLDEVGEILQRLMKDRIVSVIPKSLLRFEPTREILENGDDIHLRRCEAMLARSINLSEAFGCRPASRLFDEVLASVILIENEKVERHFLAQKRVFRKKKIPGEEVLLFYPFSVYNINSLLGAEALDSFEDYLFQDRIPLVESPSLCPGFGNGLLLCRALLGNTEATTPDLKWPWGANSVRIETFSKESLPGSGIRYLVGERTQVMPYCLIRFNPDFANRAIEHDLKHHPGHPNKDNSSSRHANMTHLHEHHQFSTSNGYQSGAHKRVLGAHSSLLPQTEKSIFPSTSMSGLKDGGDLFKSGKAGRDLDTPPEAQSSFLPTRQPKIHPNLSKYVNNVLLERPEYDEDCTICTFPLPKPGIYDEKGQDGAWLRLINCHHVFHETCLEEMMKHYREYLQCPYCKMVYGIKVGNQPPGVMTTRLLQSTLPGHPDCNTIEIYYDIKPGIQGPNHPNPGVPYHCPAFPRIAYLPNDVRGQQVLKLLQKAFEQKLTFTVGQSTTTGKDNVVTWNDIHHKTQIFPGGQHGYPDPEYLIQTIKQLAQHGIVD